MFPEKCLKKTVFTLQNGEGMWVSHWAITVDPITKLGYINKYWNEELEGRMFLERGEDNNLYLSFFEEDIEEYEIAFEVLPLDTEYSKPGDFEAIFFKGYLR